MLKNLAEWLEYIQLQHKKEMDFDLARLATVAKRLGIKSKADCSVITVGGTNGKGSCVAGLEAIYMAAGYRVGVYTSPILYKHNEYIRIQGIELQDDLFCQAFEKVEANRHETPLTFFEFNTLAAIYIFKQLKLDVWLLEVGLGGRLDAVNIIDADLAIIASIGIDHAEILGATRELIAREKAGIFRNKKPIVCGDENPPLILNEIANSLEAPFFCQGRDFNFQNQGTTWVWQSKRVCYQNLPLPQLAMQNMATVLMAVELLQKSLPVTQPAIETAIEKVKLPGRIQIQKGEVTKIFDVAHNPAATQFLVNTIKQLPRTGKLRAVFSMLGDKDIEGTILAIKDMCDYWYTAALSTKRAATIEQIMMNFQKLEVNQVTAYCSINAAYSAAVKEAASGDMLIVFGSFYTVAACYTPE